MSADRLRCEEMPLRVPEYRELFLSGVRLVAGGSVYKPDSPTCRETRPDVAGRVTKYPSVDPEGHCSPCECITSDNPYSPRHSDTSSVVWCANCCGQHYVKETERESDARGEQEQPQSPENAVQVRLDI